MRKTFLKVALIGLLAAAMPSTFTSCKDYDDDITNLNTQTADLKSQLQSVNSTITSLQSALTAAQSAADSAKSAAAAAQAAANKAQSTAEAAQAAAAAAEAEGKAAAAAAQAAAIEQAKADLEAVRIALEAAIAGKVDQSTFDTTIDGINGQIIALGDKVEALVGQMTDAQGKITNLEGVVANVNTQLSSVKGQIETLEALADALPAEFEKIGSKFADLENKLGEQNTELSNKINDAVAKLDEVSDKNAAALETINGAITALNEKVEQQGQMIAALNAEIATLKAAQAAAEEDTANKFGTLTGNVDNLVAELEALKSSIATSLGEQSAAIDALKQQIVELTQKIELIDGDTTALDTVISLLNGMITHIEVVDNVPGNDKHNGYDNTLNLYTVTVVQDLVFGQGYDTDGSGQLGFDKATFNVTNAETFKKDDIKTFSDSILVRVSPANAVVTASQIQLVNTKGEDLNNFVQITSVKPYTGLLTNVGSRSVSNNGLHVVKFALKEGFTDVEGFTAATNVGTAKKPALVKFAVAIADDDKRLAEGREITSAYDLVVNANPNAPQYELDYNVVIGKQSTPVSQIRNRFLYANDANNDNSSLMFADFDKFETQMTEVYAKRIAQTNYFTAIDNGFTAVGDFAWVENAKKEQIATYADENAKSINDDRTNEDLLEVKVGQTFTVDMSDYNVETQNGIYGFYVTLDMWRATESNGSEREAWKKVAPSIEGINAVTTNSAIDLTISNSADVDPGEVLGFRVYAVNFDGTLVDPDGRAFYVVVDQPEISSSVTASATISAPAANSYASAAIEGLGDWTTSVPEISVEFTTNGTDLYNNGTKYLNGNPLLPNEIYVVLNDGKGATLNNTSSTTIYRGSDGKGYDVLNKIRVAMPNWQYADGETYTGVLTITDAATELVLQTINVEIVKNVSNNAPAGFGINTTNGFPAEGDLTAVVTDPNATYNINTIFNWGRWNNTNLTSSDYTEVVTFQGKTNDFAAVTAEAAAGIFDLSTVTLQNRNNAQNFNNKVINNGKYPMVVTYEYATDYSYVKDVDANGNVVTLTWNINGKTVKAPNYVAKAPKYTMSRNISFVTIASQLTLSWRPASGSGNNAVAAYNPSLNYNTDYKIDLTKVVASQDITTAPDWKNATVASLVAAGKITIASVELPAGLKTYFDAAVNGNDIELTAKANTETPMANVSGQITLKVNDDITGSSTISLKLPSITMNK